MLDSDPNVESGKLSKAQYEALVAQWIAHPTNGAREALIVASLPYIKSIVCKVNNPISHLINLEDLVSIGTVAFISALGRYDPSQGASLTTFCYSRVKGAAFDAIRSLSSTSRNRNIHFIPIINDPSTEYGITEEALPTLELIEETLPDDASAQLSQSLAELPIRQRTVVLLLLNGLKATDIASLYGISSTAIQADKRLAIAALSEKLSAHLDDTISTILLR